MSVRKQRTLAVGALGLVVVGLLLWASGVSLRLPWSSGGAGESARIRPPAEFLYLDSSRALSYLAQMVGGTTTSEERSTKLNTTLSGKLAVKGLFEAGGESRAEEAEQRVVTPTAASSYIELVDLLEQNDDLKRVEIACFKCMHGLREGQFVLFKADSMRAPAYLNPYLVVKQTGTLSAIFPFAEADRTATVEHQRLAARRFASQVGDDPRIVFDLRPNGHAPNSIQYLLPAQFSGLTHERSLLKYGGGSFKVLGKVVRSFPEPTRKPGSQSSAYVDSPTRETWERPLRRALPALICRSEPQCVKRVRKHEEQPGYSRSDRLADLEKTIAEVKRSLSNQTRIDKAGAVILPIAIYK